MKTKITICKKETFIILIILLFKVSPLVAQDFTFTFIKHFKNETEVIAVGDSLKKPLLVTDNKIYAIGSDCLTRLFDSSINDRGGDGDSDERFKEGNADERKNGGAVADRNSRGRKNGRNKNGNNNDRDEDGDVNYRNRGAGSDIRRADGSVADGPRCSYTKSGKILLYTRQNLDSKKSKIYYASNFYSNKYFKIIKL